MVWSRGRRVFAFGITAALAYAILTISEVSDLLVDTNIEVSRRVLSLDDKAERRRKRAQLRKKSKKPENNLDETKREFIASAQPIVDHPIVDKPPGFVHQLEPEPIDKTAVMLKISQKEVAAERNRIAMNEFAKRSRAARTKTMMHQGAVFDDTALIQLIGFEKYRAAEDKPKILNDGTYLIFQKNPHIFFSDHYVKPNLCWKLITEPGKIKRVHYHGGNCKDFDSQFGNRLGWVYGMKMIAAAANIPFHFTCDRFDSPNGAAFLMKLNPRNDEIGPAPKNTEAEDLSLKDVCRPCGNNFCGWNGDSTYMAADTMISDWSRLAESYSDDPTDHDDAVIHLRLGDAMYARSGFSEDKGLFPHKTYIKLLKQAESEKGSIDSIGIVTAPFKGEFVRKLYDSGSTSTSEIIARDVVDALQEAFPRAKITIHNSPRETIVQANSRLVNARKVAVCGCSTFCPYPLLATKGIGYMFGPPSTKHRQNAWIFNAANRFKHFRLFETPMLNGLVINNWKTGEKLDMDVILEWLRNQDPNAGNIDIMEKPIFRFNHFPNERINQINH